jgi:hypothetical protein
VSIAAQELYLNDIQPCPQCERACNREHFAVQRLYPDSATTYLYCDHCERIWVSLFELCDGLWSWKFSLNYGPNDSLFNVEMNRLRELRGLMDLAAAAS